MLVDLYQQGRLDLDAFVTEEIGLDDVEEAFEKMHAGERAPLGGDLLMAVRVDHGVVSGTFSLDGETHDVDNNIWVVGDDEECVVIDAPHDVDAILEVVAGRTVKAIICTHAHDDHVRVAPELRERVRAPILLHPDDRPLWELTHPDRPVGRRPRGRPDRQGGRRRGQGDAHAGPRAGRGLPLRPRPRLRLHRRHPVPGRPGGHRPLVQRRGGHRRVDPAPAASSCPTRPSSTPGTATTPRSGRSGSCSG